jgi:hypothetical protein
MGIYDEILLDLLSSESESENIQNFMPMCNTVFTERNFSVKTVSNLQLTLVMKG